MSGSFVLGVGVPLNPGGGRMGARSPFFTQPRNLESFLFTLKNKHENTDPLCAVKFTAFEEEISIADLTVDGSSKNIKGGEVCSQMLPTQLTGSQDASDLKQVFFFSYQA